MSELLFIKSSFSLFSCGFSSLVCTDTTVSCESAPISAMSSVGTQGKNFLAVWTLFVRSCVVWISIFTQLVQSFVFRICHKLKIFNSVIKGVLIYVVNNLFTPKTSTQKFFHYPTMLCFGNSILHYYSISVNYGSRMMGSLPERKWVTSFFPAAKMFYTESPHPVFSFTIFNRTFSHLDRITYA